MWMGVVTSVECLLSLQEKTHSSHDKLSLFNTGRQLQNWVQLHPQVKWLVLPKHLATSFNDGIQNFCQIMQEPADREPQTT